MLNLTKRSKNNCNVKSASTWCKSKQAKAFVTTQFLWLYIMSLIDLWIWGQPTNLKAGIGKTGVSGDKKSSFLNGCPKIGRTITTLSTHYRTYFTMRSQYAKKREISVPQWENFPFQKFMFRWNLLFEKLLSVCRLFVVILAINFCINYFLLVFRLEVPSAWIPFDLKSLQLVVLELFLFLYCCIKKYRIISFFGLFDDCVNFLIVKCYYITNSAFC